MKINQFVSTFLATAVVAAGLATSPASTAQAVPAPQVATSAKGQAYTASIKANKQQLKAGEKLVISGKVSPAIKGDNVILQKRINGHQWATEAKLSTRASGAYSYTDKPSAAGTRLYRAVVPATKAHRSGKSKAVWLTVYRWLDLTKVKLRSSAGYTRRVDTVQVNGRSYSPAMRGSDYYDAGFSDWNLDRGCLKLSTRLGNSDDSDDAAIANISIVTDGTTAFENSYKLTKSQVRTIDIKKVFRLKFAWTSTNPEARIDDQSGASPVMIKPQVLCAF